MLKIPKTLTIQTIQTIVNDIARVTLGQRRKDKIPTDKLLRKSRLISVNQVSVEMIALEAWKVQNDYCDGPTPLADLLGEPRRENGRTRGAAAGLLPPPTKFPTNTFIWWTHKVWNSCPELRTAKSRNKAKRIAKTFSAQTPL